MESFKFIDLFAGIGGFHQALSNLGSDCVFASEKDTHASYVYEDNYCIKTYGDITKIKEDEIPNHDILCAGFPCQSFSISGKQKGFDDTRGTLFFDIVRIAKHKRPKVLFLENVPNLENHDKGRTFQIIVSSLNNIGYKVHHKVLKSSDYGLPQLRRRIYIIAFREDIDDSEFVFPKSQKENITVSSILDAGVAKEKYVTYKKARINRSKLKGVDYEKVIKVGEVNKGSQGDRIYSIDGLGITLSANGGGTGSKTGLYYVDGIIRKLSPRECARMQGFPEDFKIDKSDNQAWKQFGNSVSIPVIEAIYKEILNVL